MTPARASLAFLLLAPSLAAARSSETSGFEPVQVVGPFDASDIEVPSGVPGNDSLGFHNADRRRPSKPGLMSEGKPLEIAVWGGGGALAGAVVGPFGAIVGAGVGSLLGLVYSVFIVPHNGPEKRAKKLQ